MTGIVNFNSLMVRLKVNNTEKQYLIENNFNSLMVRLKGIFFASEVIFLPIFQFLDGAIKSIEMFP